MYYSSCFSGISTENKVCSRLMHLLGMGVMITVITLGCSSPLFPASLSTQEHTELAIEVQQRIERDFPFFQGRHGPASHYADTSSWPALGTFFASMDECISVPSEKFFDSLRSAVASLEDGHTSISPAPYGAYPGIRLRYFEGYGYERGIYVEELTQRRLEEGPDGLALGDRIVAVTDAHERQVSEVSGMLDSPEHQWDHLFDYLKTMISASAEHAREQHAADSLFSTALRGRPFPSDIGIRVERRGELLDLIISGGRMTDAFPEIREPYSAIISEGSSAYHYIALPAMTYFDDIDRADRFINEAIATHADGIILDIRGNGGGNSALGDYLIARFNLLETFSFSIVKGTDGSLVRTIGPHQARGEQYDGPVILLIDHEVYSAANHLTALCYYANARSIRSPAFVLVGDRTGGGSGRPHSVKLTPEFTLRISRDILVDPEGNHHERGIEPHVQVNITPSDMAAGMRVRMPEEKQFETYRHTDLVILEALKALKDH